jgi:hypothetical protein
MRIPKKEMEEVESLVKDYENGIIERCAEVAEAETSNKLLTESAVAEALHIAAAIRALKEY